MTIDDDELAERTARYAAATRSTSIAILRGGSLVVDCSTPLATSGAWDVFNTEPVLEPEPAPAIGLAFELLPNGRMRQDIASAHKSVVSMLILCARDRGLLTLDDPVSSHLGPGWSRAPAEIEATITLHHLLTMTSGLGNALEYEADPGTAWNYTLGPAWHMLKRVLPCVAGVDLETLSSEWLFEPVGLADTVWARRPGMTYLDGEPFEVLLSHAADLALLGHLVLREGTSGGREIVRATSVREMLAKSQDLNPAYGLLWWRNAPTDVQLPGATTRIEGALAPAVPPDAVAMLGALGQLCVVVPSRDLVVARVGGPAGGIDAHIGLTLLNEIWRDLVEPTFPD